MATPVGDSVAQSGFLNIDGLVQGGRWDFEGAHVLSYSFSVETELAYMWTPALQGAVRNALATWSAVADISFVEVAGHDVDTSPADLAFALTGSVLQNLVGAVAIGMFPDPVATDFMMSQLGNTREDYPHPEGDIYLDHLLPPFAHLTPGGAGLAVILHEIGHALGLKHPGDHGVNEDGPIERPIVPHVDHPWLTVMRVDTAAGMSSKHGATPLLEDIHAIQYIYGANNSFHTGDDTYLLRADGARRAIWDAGGNDTLDGRLVTPGYSIMLEPGSIMDLAPNTQVAIAFGVTIENAIGSGFANGIAGNTAANRLEGRGGNDTLRGGGGADTLIGGDGDDEYTLDHAGVTMIEAANGGVDSILSDVALGTVPANFENLRVFAGGNLDVTGNALANHIITHHGNNRIDGGAGADTLDGGDLNDVYVVDQAGDRVIENFDGGIDRVESAVGFELPINVEQLILTGLANTNGKGNELANVLTGNAGANVLDGGAGNDTLAGGRGDDTYVVDSAGDVLVEFSGQGRDTIVTPFATVLNSPFENLSISGNSSVNATGNAANNLLQGNSGNNVLDGAGGLDTMDGGAGNDSYVIDRLLEQGLIGDSGGIDTVISSANYTGLQAGLENLTLVGKAWIGLGNDTANLITGTARANILVGGGGNDTLIGGGGADLLDGGLGADRFVFDTTPGASNVDFIVGFSAVQGDRIVLDPDFYSASTFGVHILLDPGGALYYDEDGAGSGAAVQIAILNGVAGVGAASFEVIN